MNVNGLLAKPKEKGSVVRRYTVLRCLQRHNTDMAGLQETHFKSEASVKEQRWWLQREEYKLSVH